MKVASGKRETGEYACWGHHRHKHPSEAVIVNAFVRSTHTHTHTHTHTNTLPHTRAHSFTSSLYRILSLSLMFSSPSSFFVPYEVVQLHKSPICMLPLFLSHSYSTWLEDLPTNQRTNERSDIINDRRLHGRRTFFFTASSSSRPSIVSSCIGKLSSCSCLMWVCVCVCVYGSVSPSGWHYF